MRDEMRGSQEHGNGHADGQNRSRTRTQVRREHDRQGTGGVTGARRSRWRVV